LLDLHPNTAALFSEKIRQIISCHLALQASETLKLGYDIENPLSTTVTRVYSSYYTIE
jgi:hypothetical protein